MSAIPDRPSVAPPPRAGRVDGDPKQLAARRVHQRRSRIRRIRLTVAALAVAGFLIVWAYIFTQLVTGHDPALAASSRRSAVAAVAVDNRPSTSPVSAPPTGSSNGSGSSSAGSWPAGTASGSSASGSSASGSSGSGSSASGSGSSSTASASPVTTRQS